MRQTVRRRAARAAYMSDYIDREQLCVRAVGSMLCVKLGAMHRRRSSFPRAMLDFDSSASTSSDDAPPSSRALVVAPLRSGATRSPRRHHTPRVRHAIRTPPVLEIAVNAAWFRAPGSAPVDCSKRPVLWRLLLAIALGPRETARSLAHLVEAGWPGERMSRAAARNRLHVSLNRLRAMGLASILLTTDDGYVLDPTVVVRVR